MYITLILIKAFNSIQRSLCVMHNVTTGSLLLWPLVDTSAVKVDTYKILNRLLNLIGI